VTTAELLTVTPDPGLPGEAAAPLARFLQRHGLPVRGRRVVLAEEAETERALRQAAEGGGLVVCLGEGDGAEVVRQALARLLGSRLVLSDRVLEAVAAAYALALAGLVYRAFGPRELVDLLAGSLRSTAIVSLIIAGAFVVNYAVATEQLSATLAEWLSGLAPSPLGFLLLINLVFLILGSFLDTTTMLLVLVPLLLPAVSALGIDLVHFGVVIIVNMMIGLITPPYGVLLFVLNALTGIPLRAMIRELWPFIGLLILALAIMVVFPATVLWLPRQFGYKG